MAQNKKILLIIFAILLSINVSAIAVYCFFIATKEPQETAGEPIIEEQKDIAEAPIAISDDYYSLNFNYSDAVEVCMIEARSRNSNLLQLSLNERSSRYQENQNIYLIKLVSHIGTPLIYDEKEHSCEIDPNIQGVAFYREIVRRTAIRPGN